MTTNVVHQKKASYDVDIGRHRTNGHYHHIQNTDPGNPGWLGNPFVMEDTVSDSHLASGMQVVGNRELAVSRFEEVFRRKLREDDAFRDAVLDLEGQTLGCWCKPSLCHGDVIALYLNQKQDEW